MPSYEIALERNAIKALRKAPASIRQRLIAAFDALADEPRPHGHKTLDSNKKVYRIRIGSYRAIYQVNDGKLLVLVVTIANRKDVYANLQDVLKRIDAPE